MKVQVLGKVIDNKTRCVHYHQADDIIAIKFKCCGEYYPCHACHDETTNHQSAKWLKNELNEKAILCGACNEELTIVEYFSCGNKCPRCNAPFNSNCKLHYSKYFDVD
jgi:uncharacterized CHY-type Zn-finger protein